MKKQKTIKQILLNAPSVEIPFDVWRFLPGTRQTSIFGDQVSFGEGDFASIEEMQLALEWYVQQFGGTVKW